MMKNYDYLMCDFLFSIFSIFPFFFYLLERYKDLYFNEKFHSGVKLHAYVENNNKPLRNKTI